MNTAFDQRYTVHSVLFRSSAVQVMLTRKRDGGDILYLVNAISDKEWVIRYLDDFLRLRDHGAPDEFADCFSDQGRLYVVFRYQEGVALEKHLRDARLLFEEKLELAKDIMLGLSRFMNLPPVLQSALVRADNINIRQQSEIRFNFSIAYLQDNPAGKPEKSDVFTQLSRLLSTVFEDVPAIKRPQIDIILQKCARNIYTCFPEVYKDLSEIESITESQTLRRKKAEEKAKRWRSRLLAIGGAALMTACICLAVYYFIFNQESVPTINIDRIGTLDLVEQPVNPSESPAADQPVFVDNAPTELLFDEDGNPIPNEP